MLLTPAGCGQDAVFAPVGPVIVQFPAGALAIGVPMLEVSTPDDARLSLLAMVLLTMDTFNESCRDIPAPSQPARLFTMMLLVMDTLFHSVLAGVPPLPQVTNAGPPVTTHPPGNAVTSVPLTWFRRMPPRRRYPPSWPGSGWR